MNKSPRGVPVRLTRLDVSSPRKKALALARINLEGKDIKPRVFFSPSSLALSLPSFAACDFCQCCVKTTRRLDPPPPPPLRTPLLSCWSAIVAGPHANKRRDERSLDHLESPPLALIECGRRAEEEMDIMDSANFNETNLSHGPDILK